jgi:hypothetical protein
MKPSQDMFDDAVSLLHELWPNKGDNTTAKEIAHRVSKEFLKNHPNGLPPAAHVANYRGDQAFLHSFYNIVPGTSQKYGPIHPLPYGYCARSASLMATTNQLLDGQIIHPVTLVLKNSIRVDYCTCTEDTGMMVWETGYTKPEMSRDITTCLQFISLLTNHGFIKLRIQT